MKYIIQNIKGTNRERRANIVEIKRGEIYFADITKYDSKVQNRVVEDQY